MEQAANPLYPFVHDPVYPFLFCTLCKYAVLVPSTSDHLKDVHRGVVRTGRRKLVREATSRLQGMYQRKDEVEQFRFPNPGDAAIPHIREPVEDGIRCDECGWITRSTQRMAAHRRKAHEGGSRVRWRTGVRCQQLFAKGPHSGWFEVRREEDVFTSELAAWLQGGDEGRMYVSQVCRLTMLRTRKQIRTTR
jgi:hypothetical protein